MGREWRGQSQRIIVAVKPCLFRITARMYRDELKMLPPESGTQQSRRGTSDTEIETVEDT